MMDGKHQLKKNSKLMRAGKIFVFVHYIIKDGIKRSN